MAVALDKAIGTRWSRHRVAIECASELTRGMTVVDRLNVSGDSNNAAVWAQTIRSGADADICWTFDAAGFKRMLKRALS